MDQPQFELATVDIVIVIVYFVGVVAHGIYMSRKGNDSSEGYFLAGRGLPWYLIGFSLFASNMSGSSFVGLMGGTYANGIVIYNYEWTATLVLIFFAFFILPYFLRAKLHTVPEFLEKRFDQRSRRAYSAFTVLAVIFIDASAAVYAGGLVITQVFPIQLWLAAAILAAVAGLYTILGGLAAVVVTDTVQAILLIIGSLIIFVLGLNAVGGWEQMFAGVPTEQTSIIQPPSDDFVPWPGLLGVLFVGFYFWSFNQFIVQRTLGAKDLDEGRKGALFAGLLKLPNIFIMVLPGLIALQLYPNLSNPDLAFPALAFDLLPVGLRGLIMAALIAAIMSSLDSAFNAVSSMVTMDFVKPLRPDLSQINLVKIGRVFTGVAMVIVAVYAPLIANFETLFGYLQSALSFLVPALVAIFFLGLFWKRANADSAFYTIILTLVIGIPLFIMMEVTNVWNSFGFPDVHFTYMGIFMFILGTLLVVGISLAGEEPDEERVRQYAFTRENYHKDVANVDKVWYRDFRYQSIGLAVMMAVVVVAFW